MFTISAIQTEQDKMASHSQMGGSGESRFHPSGWIFLQWSDNEAGKVMTVPSAEDYALKILDRGTNPLSSYPDCASMTAASFQLLILQNETYAQRGEKHPILVSLVICRHVLISYSVCSGFD